MDEKRSIDLDICGQICPSCLLLTLKAVNEHQAALRAGRCEVVVTTDDRQATDTIPTTVAKMGYGADITAVQDRYRIRVYAHTPEGGGHGDAT